MNIQKENELIFTLKLYLSINFPQIILPLALNIEANEPTIAK